MPNFVGSSAITTRTPISGWRQKVTASGAVRFFADAAARIEDTTP
jgi:hypothetical protein